MKESSASGLASLEEGPNPESDSVRLGPGVCLGGEGDDHIEAFIGKAVTFALMEVTFAQYKINHL